MKLGRNVTMQSGRHFHGQHLAGHGAGHRRPAPRVSSRSTDPEASGKATLALHCIAGARRSGSELRSSTWNTRWTLPPRRWVLISTALLVSQPDAGGRRWRSARRWCARAPSTVWSWTPWRPWCPVPRSGKMGDAHVEPAGRLIGQTMHQAAGMSARQAPSCLHQPAAFEIGHRIQQSEAAAGGNAAEILFLCAYRRAPYRRQLRIPLVL